MLSLAASLANGYRATEGQNKSQDTSPLPPTLVRLICGRKKGFQCWRFLFFATYLSSLWFVIYFCHGDLPADY